MTLNSFKQLFLMKTVETTLERKRETERLKERIYSQWKVIKIVDKSQLFIYSVNLKEMFSETAVWMNSTLNELQFVKIILK